MDCYVADDYLGNKQWIPWEIVIIYIRVRVCSDAKTAGDWIELLGADDSWGMPILHVLNVTYIRVEGHPIYVGGYPTY